MEFLKYMTAADVGIVVLFDLALFVLGFMVGDDKETTPEKKKEVK